MWANASDWHKKGGFALKRVLLIALFVVSVVAGASQAAALPLFTESSKRAVFLSPLEGWMPTWNLDTYVTLLERAGYSVDVLLNENVTIAFLETQLVDYDIIILRTQSFEWRGTSYFCSGEPATIQTRNEPTVLSEVRVDVCTGFTAAFLQRNYPADSLRHGLVYVLGSSTAELAPVFLGAGSSVFIGYEDEFTLGWGRMDAFSQALFRYLCDYNVRDAVARLYGYLNTGHGRDGKWPMIFWKGDGTFKI